MLEEAGPACKGQTMKEGRQAWRFADFLSAPDEIEAKSFEIIQAELGAPLEGELAPLSLRVIHATADFEHAHSLQAPPGAVAAALRALRGGARVVADTNMALAGIDKRRLAALGASACCFASDPDVAEAAAAQGITRAMAAVDKASTLPPPLIFAVGNAPTALLRICGLAAAGRLSVDFVAGACVGFVNVLESKEALMGSGIPHVAVRGRKGGSPVAAAIMNALLRMALGE
jgi:precorrin-8X/cobalt-precorrin-8 methylmutase